MYSIVSRADSADKQDDLLYFQHLSESRFLLGAYIEQ